MPHASHRNRTLEHAIAGIPHRAQPTPHSQRRDLRPLAPPRIPGLQHTDHVHDARPPHAPRTRRRRYSPHATRPEYGPTCWPNPPGTCAHARTRLPRPYRAPSSTAPPSPLCEASTFSGPPITSAEPRTTHAGEPLSNDTDEHEAHPQIPRHLRVKRGGEYVPLPHHDDAPGRGESGGPCPTGPYEHLAAPGRCPRTACAQNPLPPPSTEMASTRHARSRTLPNHIDKPARTRRSPRHR